MITRYLLGGYEILVGDLYKDKLFSNAMGVLKAFYDEDVLDEETILEWATKQSKKYVGKEMSRKIHEKVAPFVKWLKEAEVEEDEEDREEHNGERGDDEEVSDGGNSSTKSNESEEKRAANKLLNANGSDKLDDGDDEIEFSHRVSGIRIQKVAKTKAAAAGGLVNAAEAEASLDAAEDLDIDNI